MHAVFAEVVHSLEPSFRRLTAMAPLRFATLPRIMPSRASTSFRKVPDISTLDVAVESESDSDAIAGKPLRTAWRRLPSDLLGKRRAAFRRLTKRTALARH